MPGSDIEAEAAEWLIRLERDSAPQTQAAFAEWLAADARHRAMYVRLEKTWRHADILHKLQPLDGDIDANVLDKFAQPAVSAPPRAGGKRWPALAGAALLLAMGAVAGIVFERSGWQAYTTELGGFQRVRLEDGSTVLLNTNSEIRVKLTKEHREVVLAKGEALFTIAHDAQRPFDVSVADTIVRAVGTAFAVRLREQGRAEIFVTEGRVAVDPPADSTLSAGQAATVRERHLDVRKIEAEEMARKLAWTHGRLWFDHATLAEAILEFNRYNHRQLVIDDPSIENLHIGGTFDVTDLDSFLATLRPLKVRSTVAPEGAQGTAAAPIHLFRTQPKEP
jgi:transmembrane sensor